MIGTFKVAHLLGITRDHEKEFRNVERILTKNGFICFAPVIYNYDEYMMNQSMIDDMCYAKLRVSDLCVIVTPDHIGQSTTRRIWQAESLGIPVFVWKNGVLEEYREDNSNG